MTSIFGLFRCCRLNVLGVPYRQNSNSACLGRARRHRYPRLYPTTIVNHDGSTYTARYHDPRQIIFLPLEFDSLSEEEQLKVLHNRKPKKKVEITEDTLDGDTFSANMYLSKFK